MQNIPLTILFCLYFILSPTANTTLHAQLEQVFEADSTNQWWVRQKGGNLYYGYVRALGTDSIRVIEGDRGEKRLAIAEVQRVTPKGANVVSINKVRRKRYGQHLQPFLYNALPHQNEVYIKLRYNFTPEIEVNFSNRHTIAAFMEVLGENAGVDYFGLRYRYAVPLNTRLHWSGGLAYVRAPEGYFRRSLAENQILITSVFTYDAQFIHLSAGPVFIFQNTPPSAFTRGEYGSGVALATMAQIPLGRFFSLNADWLYVPKYLPDAPFRFSADYSGQNLLCGIKFHSRHFHVQLGYVERAKLGRNYGQNIERFRGTFSFRFGKK
jgi:hypothetical protein